jgi:hypothetical protein
MSQQGVTIFIAGPERHERLRELSLRTDLSMAEWMRRMLDHCLAEPVLNQLAPAWSGQLNNREVR